MNPGGYFLQSVEPERLCRRRSIISSPSYRHHAHHLYLDRPKSVIIGPDVAGVVEGSATAQLTLYNVQSSDAGTYTVEVSNDDGANTATSSGATLTVNSVPSDYLYAETVPYIGPTADIPTSTIGWVTAFRRRRRHAIRVAAALGAVYAYEPSVETIIYYTDMGTDTGQAGLAFPSINPANYQYIALQTSLDANSVVTDDTAYFAVQMTSGSVSNWYVIRTPIDDGPHGERGISESAVAVHRPPGSQWNNLTITSTNAVDRQRGFRHSRRQYHRRWLGLSFRWGTAGTSITEQFADHHRSRCGHCASD